MAKAKGFSPPRREVRLVFEDEEYSGLEVVCGFDLPLSMYLGYLPDGKTAEDIEKTYRQFGRDVLVSWNVLDGDGKAVPATGDGMMAIPLPFASAVLRVWLGAMAGPSDPLEQPSKNGSTAGAKSRRKSKRPS